MEIEALSEIAELRREIVDFRHEFRGDLQALTRAVRGAPLEGNPGILDRVGKVERKVTLLVIAMIPAVTVGTAVGKLISDWLGI